MRALAISADGKHAVSGSFDTSAIRWSLERNAAEQVLRFHDGAVNAVAFCQDGRIATGGEDAHIAIWQPGEPQPADGARRPHRADRGAGGVARRQDCSPRHRGITPCGCGRLPAARRACSKAMRRTSTASPSRPTASALVSAGYDATLRIWPLRRRRADRRDAADAAQYGGGRARRRDRHRRRRRQGLFPFAAGRAARRGRRPRATPIIAVAVSRRRQAGRRRRHPRLGRDHRPQRPQARAHAGRTRPAGVVGGLLSRQPHAAHRRHRPHDPPLGCDQRRADRRGRGRRAGRSAGAPMPAIRGARGVPRLRRLPHAVARRRQPRRPDARAAFSAAGSRRCPATIFRRR